MGDSRAYEKHTDGIRNATQEKFETLEQSHSAHAAGPSDRKTTCIKAFMKTCKSGHAQPTRRSLASTNARAHRTQHGAMEDERNVNESDDEIDPDTQKGHASEPEPEEPRQEIPASQLKLQEEKARSEQIDVDALEDPPTVVAHIEAPDKSERAIENAKAENLLEFIARLKREKAAARDTKKLVAKNLKNAERRKARLKRKARQLNDEDLIAVLQMRKDAPPAASSGSTGDPKPPAGPNGRGKGTRKK